MRLTDVERESALIVLLSSAVAHTKLSYFQERMADAKKGGVVRRRHRPLSTTLRRVSSTTPASHFLRWPSFSEKTLQFALLLAPPDHNINNEIRGPPHTSLNFTRYHVPHARPSR